MVVVWRRGGGFQAWCLARNSAELGNLVLVEHAEASTEHKHPVYFAWAASDGGADSTSSTSANASTAAAGGGGELLKLNHVTSELHERYSSWREAPLKFEYPTALRPGECILMHRAQLHASDPRRPAAPPPKWASDRRAFTVRFIVLPTPEAPLPIWLNGGYAKRFVLDGHHLEVPSSMPSGPEKGPANGTARSARSPTWTCRLHPKLSGWCTLNRHGQHHFRMFLS